MKFASILLVALMCAACDQPPQPAQPPTPKTDQPYTGIYQEQVNALDKARDVGATLQQSEEARQRQVEQAAQ